MDPLHGIICALWSPTDERGHILEADLERHLAFVLEAGVDGVMPMGSTGEFIHFSVSDRTALLDRVVGITRRFDKMQIIANVSDVQFRNVVSLGQHAKSAGATCISVLPPWYFPLEQRDMAEFFVQVGRATRAPLALYNYPEVTGKKISLETIEKVASETEVVAVKQSGADFAYHNDLIRLGREKGFVVLTGSDTRMVEAFRLGCSGVISGLANAIPELLCQIVQNFPRGNDSEHETALVSELAKKIGPLTFPLNVMATVAARGFNTGTPKMPISVETRHKYEEVVKNLSDWLKKTANCSDKISSSEPS